MMFVVLDSFSTGGIFNFDHFIGMQLNRKVKNTCMNSDSKGMKLFLVPLFCFAISLVINVFVLGEV
jgi:hypothetical protein